jgi:putative ABC transport system permease protein
MIEVGEKERNHRVHREMQERLARLPQVEAVAAVETTPLRVGRSQYFEIPGVERVGTEWTVFMNAVDPAYFPLTGIPIVAGRGFVDAENTEHGRPAVIVSRALAHRYWPERTALGQCIRVGGDEPCAEIVGIAADASMWPTLADRPSESLIYYVPLERYRSTPGDRALLVRTTTSPSGLLDLLRRQAATAAPDLPHIRVTAFDDVFLPALRPLRLGSTVFAVFALMALVIASAGLAAVTAAGVARRTRELGIRLALGAAPARLVRMVLLRSLAAAIVGLAAGTALSVAGERSLRSVLFGIGEGDYRVVALALVILAGVSAVAAWLPARRAG